MSDTQAMPQFLDVSDIAEICGQLLLQSLLELLKLRWAGKKAVARCLSLLVNYGYLSLLQSASYALI